MGGQTEFRLREASEGGGGTAFADYVWKPVVLIEMKKRGVNLQPHLSQAFRCWERLVPNRPRYVVLCNFDEFRIYDFDSDLDAPKDKFALADLPERWERCWPASRHVRPAIATGRLPICGSPGSIRSAHGMAGKCQKSSVRVKSEDCPPFRRPFASNNTRGARVLIEVRPVFSKRVARFGIPHESLFLFTRRIALLLFLLFRNVGAVMTENYDFEIVVVGLADH